MRGWGPQLLDKIILEVSKVLTNSSNNSSKLRQDDIPLDDENKADY